MLKNRIKEGELYQVLTIDGEQFEIRYGYYEERDRVSKYNDPIPIYPDFIKTPKYNSDGYPFVTEMQDTCKYFSGKLMVDICCGCAHYKKGDDLIGICQCEHRQISIHKGEEL